MYYRWPDFYNMMIINQYEQMNDGMRYSNMTRSYGKRSSSEKNSL